MLPNSLNLFNGVCRFAQSLLDLLNERFTFSQNIYLNSFAVTMITNNIISFSQRNTGFKSNYLIRNSAIFISMIDHILGALVSKYLE